MRFYLTHAMPSNPLYGRCALDDQQCIEEMEAKAKDILLFGHTHIPFIRCIGEKVLLNPGSIGQPRSGGSLGSYAVWWNGQFELRTFQYPVERTVRKLRALSLPLPVESELVGILQTGSVLDNMA
jgi:predicted phosphodiesterase